MRAHVPPGPSILFGSLPPGQTAAFFLPLDGTQAYSVGPNANNRTKQLNVVDDLSFTLGAHQLKFGGDYRAIFSITSLSRITSSIYLLVCRISSRLGRCFYLFPKPHFLHEYSHSQRRFMRKTVGKSHEELS